MGKYQSGQMGQTVNLLACAFGGSNPSLPTTSCGSSSVDRASAFQAEGREFEPRLPLKKQKNLDENSPRFFLFIPVRECLSWFVVGYSVIAFAIANHHA